MALKFLISVETCGPPQIQNTMMNQTKYPGESAHFKCQVIKTNNTNVIKRNLTQFVRALGDHLKESCLLLLFCFGWLQVMDPAMKILWPESQ